ncbi:MAG: hypothetical protein HOP16_11495 [Acidobacteria bacterium]|nr:hypothetical protein [Acidobacteriota bacterium]
MAKQLTVPTPPASLKKWTKKDRELNSFALRSFRDVADADYIAARLAYRAQLPVQFLWASQQALEKYLKFILFLERIKVPKLGHDLAPVECPGDLHPALTHNLRLGSVVGLGSKAHVRVDRSDLD